MAPDIPVSPYARELVEGGYDTHIHVAPDVLRRRIDDVSLARRFEKAGLAGFVLKSHYVPTTERAEVVSTVVPGCNALGAITLNASVGGMNPVAVEIAGRGGAKVVWFPTVDSANQIACRAQDPPGATPPMWAALQDDLRDKGMAAPPVAVMDDSGQVTEGVRQVLEVIRAHDMVLATGHLSGPEILAVVDAAVEAKIARIVVTHPEFTSQRLVVQTQRQLAARGALLERCFTTPHSGKVSWADFYAHIRAVGPECSVLSSDLGQPFNPPVEDGLALLADRLLANGFTGKEVHTMAVRNSRWLVGDD